MTKTRSRLPVLRRHKRSRRAYATFNGAALRALLASRQVYAEAIAS